MYINNIEPVVITSQDKKRAEKKTTTKKTCKYATGRTCTPLLNPPFSVWSEEPNRLMDGVVW